MIYRIIVAASHTIDWVGLSAVIAALGTATVAVIGAGVAGYVKIKTMQSKIMEEVKKNTVATHTSNGTAMGQLAEASETRRISRISPENRTDQETEHISEVPLPTRPSDSVKFLKS